MGLPEPAIYTGAAAEKQAASDKQYANVPQQNYAPFVASMTKIPVKLEPPNAQQIYAVLDVSMQKVLTDKNANIDQLLTDANAKAQRAIDSAG